MENIVLNILSDGRSLTLNEISTKSGINNLEKTKKILDSLVDELEVFVTRKNKYSIFSNSKMLKGKVNLLKDGSGYVILDDYEKVYVSKRDLHCAKDDDIVAIEIVSNKQNGKTGRVVLIKKRDNKRVIGEVVVKNDIVYIKPDTKEDYYINYYGNKDNLVNGLKVVVELTNKVNDKIYACDIVEIIGHKDDPNVDILSVIKKYNIVIDFPEEVLKDAEEINDEVIEEDIQECLSHGGKDLRSELTFTIDGDDTKDFDDAITIKKENDTYNLKVSIANVSLYAGVDSNIFNEAMRRGTSVYLANSSIPMLPRKLSNGICSLNPGVDRMALTFDMTFDLEGNIIDFQIYDSIINSKKRMTYSEVNKILEDGLYIDGYNDFINELTISKELSELIRKNKMDRGYIDFEIEEAKIKVDEKGKATDIKRYDRGISEKIIEDFMVITGEYTSMFLDDIAKDKHIYRVHDLPREEKIYRLKMYLDLLKCKTDRLDELSAKNMQLLLSQVKDRKQYLIIARELLKCMQKAYYSTKNIGHFALAIPSDCQITSPIRRAGDLVNHVLVRDAIYSTGVGSLTKNKMDFLALNASRTERNAASCEAEVNKMKMAEYMFSHIGKEYQGMITHICKNGFYVELPNLVEGFVDIKSLVDDKYIYNEEKFSLIGKNKHKRYFLGDKVDIIVKGVNISERIIDFEVKEKEKSKVKKLNN